MKRIDKFLKFFIHIFIILSLTFTPFSFSKENSQKNKKQQGRVKDEKMITYEGEPYVDSKGRKVYSICYDSVDDPDPGCQEEEKDGLDAHGNEEKDEDGRGNKRSRESKRNKTGSGDLFFFPSKIDHNQMMEEAHQYLEEEFSQAVKQSAVQTFDNALSDMKKKIAPLLKSQEINSHWIKRVKTLLKEIENKIGASIENSDAMVIAYTPYGRGFIKQHIFSEVKKGVYDQITSYRWDLLLNQKLDQIENLLEDIHDKELLGKAFFNISQLENEMKEIKNTPLPISEIPHYQMNNIYFSYKAHEYENLFYEKIHKLAEEHHILPTQKKLDQDLSTLNTQSDKLKEQIEEMDDNFSFSYSSVYNSRTYEERVNDRLQIQYPRKELGLLEDSELSYPREFYRFTSPESEFLDKLKTLYQKLKESNPYHEQGVLARTIGLKAVEISDQENSKGNIEEAQFSYEVAETMSDIALGVMPYVGTGKDIYELFTGKHLLTGRSLSSFEMSMSLVGILLSGVSGGAFNSGQLKLALKSTKNILDKININLLSKNKIGLSSLQTGKIRQYAKSFIESMEQIGIRTTKDMKSAIQLMKRAYAGENPPIKDISHFAHKIGKNGIESYTRVVDQIKGLFNLGKRFLAKRLRYYDGVISEDNLLKTGKIYAQISKNFKNISIKSIDQIKTLKPFIKSDNSLVVWRGAKETLADNMFKQGQPVKRKFARYSMPEDDVIYTSLKKETATIEVGAKPSVDLETKKIKKYIFKSKEIKPDRILDLTDLQTIGKLNKNLKLTKSFEKSLVNQGRFPYELTQVIGDVARNKGNIDAILAPSAKHSGGINVIILKGLE